MNFYTNVSDAVRGNKTTLDTSKAKASTNARCKQLVHRRYFLGCEMNNDFWEFYVYLS